MPLCDLGCVEQIYSEASVDFAAGPTEGLSGARYSPTYEYDEITALAHLRSSRTRAQRYKFTNGEPNWYHVGAAIDIAATLDVPNRAAIDSALSVSSITLGPISVASPLEEIRTVRNFCAHKNWKTLADMRMYDAHLVSLRTYLREKNAGVQRFDNWLDALRAIASVAAE